MLEFPRSLAAAKLDLNYELEILKLARVVKNISISVSRAFCVELSSSCATALYMYVLHSAVSCDEFMLSVAAYLESGL